MKSKVHIGFFLLFVIVSCSNNSLEEEKLKLEQEKLKLEREKLGIEKNKVQTQQNNSVSSNNVISSREKKAKITGGKVHIREDHSTTAGSLGLIKSGEIVSVFDQYTPEGNHGEAILRMPVKFYYENTDIVAFTLIKGKAVQIVTEYNDYYRISFVDEKSRKTAYANINPNDLELISGELWYYISTSSGKKGWVFGKYIQVI
jgi:hypothetical protein